MKIPHAVLTAALAAAAASLPVCGAAADPIKIGELNSYKVFPAFLEPYKKGWQLALEEINAAGGVNGHKLEVVSRDDGGDPGTVDVGGFAHDGSFRMRDGASYRQVGITP